MLSLLNEIKSRFINKTRFLYGYTKSFYGGIIKSGMFKDIQDFCLFIGYGRSGHTLLASILNAHPEIVIGIEWGVFTYIKLGYRKKQILYSLLENSKRYSNVLENVWTGYSYNIQNSWQGKFSTLKVIGDKHGGMNAERLITNPTLLELTEKRMGLKPKIIHAIRNPFDVITTITIRRYEKRDPFYTPSNLDLLSYIELFFKHADILKGLKEGGNYEIIDIYHENLINNPKEIIKKLTNFFKLQADESYYENCASILYKNPNKSRNNIKWPKSLIKYVEKKVVEYPFLQHYSFND